jgi:hypothetical protein
MTLPICQGVTKAGNACTYRGRHEGFCKFHAPKKFGDCPICFEEVTSKTSTTTRCKHVFHKACLERWTEENNTCPMCRATIKERPTTGQLRPRVMVHEFRSLDATELARLWQLALVEHSELDNEGDVVYLYPTAGLEDFLASMRNAPVEFIFTN